MKTKSVLGGCIMALFAVASVAAYAQMKTTDIAGAQNAGRGCFQKRLRER
jgi:hypothetical protein